MNRTEKAYQLGYRATEHGKLEYNNTEIPINTKKKNSGRDLLYFTVPGINGMLYISKLLAYLKYGKLALYENCMYIDGDTRNCAEKNITIKSIYKKLLLEQNSYYCSTCNKVLDLSNFYGGDLREHKCPYRIAQCKDCIQNRVRKNREYMMDRKLSGCCICGEKDIACLDFHHIADKYDQVSHMLTHSINRIKQEIDKCVILCSNCHRKLHYYKLTVKELKQRHK